MDFFLKELLDFIAFDGFSPPTFPHAPKIPDSVYYITKYKNFAVS